MTVAQRDMHFRMCTLVSVRRTDGVVNGATPSAGIPEPPRLQGRGGELFAKRQSRADRYVVEATPSPGLGPRPRSPSPTPPHTMPYTLMRAHTCLAIYQKFLVEFSSLLI